MSILYGRREPAGEGMMLISTAFVIYNKRSEKSVTEVRIFGACLPRFDYDTHARPKKDHPAGVLVIVDKIEQNDRLDEDIGDDLHRR